MEAQEVREHLTRIAEEVSVARRCWAVLKEIDDRSVPGPVFNSYRGFFNPVYYALLRTMILGFAKVLDYDSRSVSLSNLLKIAKRDPDYFPIVISPDEITCLRQRIAAHKQTTKAIIKLRNKVIAHLDAANEVQDLNGTFSIGDREKWEAYITTIEEVLNTLAYAHDQSRYQTYANDTQCAEQTKMILDLLPTPWKSELNGRVIVAMVAPELPTTRRIAC